MKDKQTTQVPKLRFPEFRGAGGWSEKRLGSEGAFLSSLSGKAGTDFDTGEAKFVTYMNVFSNTFADPKELRLVDVKEGETQNKVVRGDVFFTISSETPEEVGMSSVLLEEIDNCYLNSFCTLFRFSKDTHPNPVFAGYLLRQPLVRHYFAKKAQGSTRFNLSKDTFKNLPFLLPSPPEQQKIADCLSSLDELIAAQARKVDALKTHKKGLMQQLFPREGETQPRLRFPEFRDAGEWEWVELGEKVDLLSGYPFDGPDISQDSSGIPLLRGINVTEGRIRHNSEIDRYYIGSTEGLEKYRLQVNDLVIGMDGSKVGKNSALVSANDVGALLIQRIARLRAKKVSLIQFIFQRVHSPSFHAYVDRINTSSGIPHISAKQIKEFRICFPSDVEQQRIADCLTSLDTLITTATQELDTFKTHKKGLMQQLFPSTEAVEV